MTGGINGCRLSGSSPTDHHHISFLNCIMRNMNPGIGIEASGASNIQVIGCLIHDVGADNFEHGIYAARYSTGWLVKSCTIYNISGYGLHFYDDTVLPVDCRLEANRIRNCGKAGIITYGSGHSIFNNRSYKNGTNGILLRQADSVLVMNNTTYQNGQIESGDKGIVKESGSSCVAKNNIVYQDGSITGFETSTPNFVGTNPLFVDPENGDFSLQEGSPAIDTAEDLSAYFLTDCNGHFRG